MPRVKGCDAFCPELEKDYPTEFKEFTRQNMSCICTTTDLAAYIERNKDTGCLLAEVLACPENTRLVDIKDYAHTTFNVYEYTGAPKVKCATCPLRDCVASDCEMRGYIAQTRLIALRQNLLQEAN
jgi:hypothetical protein